MAEHISDPSTNSLAGSRDGDWPSTSESSYEILQRAADRVASSGALNLPLDPFWDIGNASSIVPSVLDRGLDHLADASHAQQLTAGGISGWLSGFLFNKIGRPVLYFAGGSLIIILFMEHQGYLKVDWHKVGHDAGAGRKVVQKKIHAVQEQISAITTNPAVTPIVRRRNGKPWLDKLKILAVSSPYLSGGFLGGVLLGLAS
ncbi:hypothetical protein RvY_03372 [Ramazzottius varieornatus]|uniref:FUN14 domain-containing protein n=1 Tax=Ramazzottius varieornatus TaxID=947166 RepID=A0A1D1UTK7_RAMVA|nr:hypothetical protein RvY_03372 [Ramazzottius varieornatus]